ncbi:MAG: L,D-transpeptidase [Ferruginibacter sp.]
MRRIIVLKLILVAFIFMQCNQPGIIDVKNARHKAAKKRTLPKTVGYHFENYREWVKNNKNSDKEPIVLAVNRTDNNNIAKMDSIIVPNDLTGDKESYLPFPFKVGAIEEIEKIIFFSYSTQTFGAYEFGDLIYSGPVNMGRKNDPTPSGLYFTNWKAEKTTSTFNDEWDLRWNVNIENKLGIGWHQYELPGYPASHSCLRLQEKDARLLYDWAEQWIMDDKEIVKAQGTPVIVFGRYDFDAPKPWLQLTNDPHALDITRSALTEELKPFLAEIMAQRKRRAAAIEHDNKNGK